MSLRHSSRKGSTLRMMDERCAAGAQDARKLRNEGFDVYGLNVNEDVERPDAVNRSIRVIRNPMHTGESIKQKSPTSLRSGFVAEDGLAVTYFRVRNCTLSSAQTCFTVLFGMGRCGARLL